MLLKYLSGIAKNRFPWAPENIIKLFEKASGKVLLFSVILWESGVIKKIQCYYLLCKLMGKNMYKLGQPLGLFCFVIYVVLKSM